MILIDLHLHDFLAVFLLPKQFVDEDVTHGDRNDVVAGLVVHKESQLKVLLTQEEPLVLCTILLDILKILNIEV